MATIWTPNLALTEEWDDGGRPRDVGATETSPTSNSTTVTLKVPQAEIEQIANLTGIETTNPLCRNQTLRSVDIQGVGKNYKMTGTPGDSGSPLERLEWDQYRAVATYSWSVDDAISNEMWDLFISDPQNPPSNNFKFYGDAQASTQNLTLPQDYYGFISVSDANKLAPPRSLSMVKAVSILNYQFTRRNAPGVYSNWIDWLGRIGKASDKFPLKGLPDPAGTTDWREYNADQVLYTSFSVTPHRSEECFPTTTLEEVNVDVTLDFVVRPEAGWNKFFNPDGDVWEAIYKQNVSPPEEAKPYTEQDSPPLIRLIEFDPDAP